MVDRQSKRGYNNSIVNNSPFRRGLIVVLIMALLAGGLIFANRIVAGDAFGKEEAQHGLYGLWIWRDIHGLDWGGFWYDTSRQLTWPFLHSWLLSIFFLIFGVGYSSARFLSLVFFLGSAILVYILSNTLSEKTGWKIGILSCALVFTSPLMVRFASQNVLEGMGAFLYLLAAYLYTVCEERKDLIHYILLTLLFGLALYTNYIYAYFIVVSFLVVTISKLGPLFVEAYNISRKGEKVAMHFIWWAYRKLIVMGVLLLIIAAWFSFNFSRKLMLLVKNIFRYSGGVEAEGFWQALIYYPKVIISNLSFSPWLGVFLLIFLLIPFIASRYRGLNRLYVYVWTPLILATLTVPAKVPQMIYIIAPFIFIIFASALFFLIVKGQETNKKLLKILLLVFIIPIIFSLPRAYAIFFPSQPAQSMVEVLEYFHGNVPPSAAVATIVNLQHFNPEAVKFHFRDWQAPVLADEELKEDELFGENGAERYYLSMDLDWESPYQKDVVDDSLFRWNSWLKQREMDGEIRFYSSRRFGEIGVTAKIYKKTD